MLFKLNLFCSWPKIYNLPMFFVGPRATQPPANGDQGHAPYGPVCVWLVQSEDWHTDEDEGPTFCKHAFCTDFSLNMTVIIRKFKSTHLHFVRFVGLVMHSSIKKWDFFSKYYQYLIRKKPHLLSSLHCHSSALKIEVDLFLNSD